MPGGRWVVWDGAKMAGGKQPLPQATCPGPTQHTVYLQASFSNTLSLAPGPTWASQILLCGGPPFTLSRQLHPSRGSRRTWDASLLGTSSPQQRPSAPPPAP